MANYAFGAGAAPISEDMQSAESKLAIMLYLGSPTYHGGPDAVGFFLPRDVIESDHINKDFNAPPVGFKKADRTLGGKTVQGWAPDGPLSFYVLRTAMRWFVTDDPEYQVYYTYREAQARKESGALPGRPKSKWRALLMIPALGEVPIVVSVSGTIGSDFNKICGWSRNAQYASYVQKMSEAATEYAKGKNNARYGRSVFLLPVEPKEKSALRGSGQKSPVVPPVLTGAPDTPASVDVAVAIRYFDQEASSLWGKGGLFDEWLAKDSEIVAAWDHMNRVSADADASESDEEKPDDVPGFPLAPSVAPAPAPAPASLDVVRRTYMAGALNDGHTDTAIAPDSPLWGEFYNALRGAGYEATAGNAQRFMDKFLGGTGNSTYTLRNVYAATSLITRSPEYLAPMGLTKP